MSHGHGVDSFSHIFRKGNIKSWGEQISDLVFPVEPATRFPFNSTYVCAHCHICGAHVVQLLCHGDASGDGDHSVGQWWKHLDE
jgi:hypothetical protein